MYIYVVQIHIYTYIIRLVTCCNLLPYRFICYSNLRLLTTACPPYSASCILQICQGKHMEWLRPCQRTMSSRSRCKSPPRNRLRTVTMRTSWRAAESSSWCHRKGPVVTTAATSLPRRRGPVVPTAAMQGKRLANTPAAMQMMMEMQFSCQASPLLRSRPRRPFSQKASSSLSCWATMKV